FVFHGADQILLRCNGHANGVGVDGKAHAFSIHGVRLNNDSILTPCQTYLSPSFLPLQILQLHQQTLTKERDLGAPSAHRVSSVYILEHAVAEDRAASTIVPYRPLPGSKP